MGGPDIDGLGEVPIWTTGRIGSKVSVGSFVSCVGERPRTNYSACDADSHSV